MTKTIHKLRKIQRENREMPGRNYRNNGDLNDGKQNIGGTYSPQNFEKCDRSNYDRKVSMIKKYLLRN